MPNWGNPPRVAAPCYAAGSSQHCSTTTVAILQLSALQHQCCRHVTLQGVSSGDPFAKSVILWARVTVPQANKPAFLDYCVSKDRRFRKCVTRGTTLTNKDVDFTAKVRQVQYQPRNWTGIFA